LIFKALSAIIIQNFEDSMPISLENIHFKLPLAQPAPMLGSEWVGRLIAPLHASVLSKEGMGEIAERVRYMGLAAIIALIVISIRFISSRETTASIAESADKSTTPSGDIARDLKIIEVQFDELLKNLRGLKGQAGTNLNERIQNFKRAYANSVTTVELIESNYKFLLEMNGAIFFTKSYMDDQNIVHMPQDGNCLFHALGRGLALLEPQLRRNGVWNNFPQDHLSIREKVTDYIRTHIHQDQELQGHIDNAIVEYIPILIEQQRKDHLTIKSEEGKSDVSELTAAYEAKEIQINALKSADAEIRRAMYLQMTQDEGKFTSTPHMFAFCKLNPAVGIRISRKIEFPARNGAPAREVISNDFDLPFNPEASLFINPVYNKTGDHFDLHIDHS
jgi:hypothetical protein